MRFSAALLSLLALFSWTASTAVAGSYGDFIGSTVSFEDVNDQNDLFGMPTVSGDSLDFSPNSFEADCAASACAPSPLQVDDTLNFFIRANTGSFIDTIVLQEAGDTTLSSFLGAFAATQVTATVFIDIFEVNGVSINNISAQAQMVFNNSGQFETNDEGTGTHIWTGALNIDLDQILADAGVSGQATLVELNLNNTLIAFAESGASARIEKKDIDGLAITVVPEPGTAILMGLGLIGLTVSGRRGAREI